MPNALLLVPALLAGLSMGAIQTNPAFPPGTMHGVTPGHSCQTAGTERLIGRLRSPATRSAVLRVTHAAIVRWAPPGIMLTMDFRFDRATVYLGPDNRITQIKCM